MTILTGALFTLGIVIPRSVMHLHHKAYEGVATQLAESLLNVTRGLDPAQVPNGRWVTSPGSSGSDDGQLPVYRGSRRQFPPAPFPADGKSPALRRFVVNAEPNALDRGLSMFGGDDSAKDDPGTDIPYYFDVEVVASEPSSPRPITVTVLWPEKAADATAGDVRNFRRFTLSSKVGQ